MRKNKKIEDSYFMMLKPIKCKADVILHERMQKAIKNFDFEEYHKLRKSV